MLKGDPCDPYHTFVAWRATAIIPWSAPLASRATPITLSWSVLIKLQETLPRRRTIRATSCRLAASWLLLASSWLPPGLQETLPCRRAIRATSITLSWPEHTSRPPSWLLPGSLLAPSWHPPHSVLVVSWLLSLLSSWLLLAPHSLLAPSWHPPHSLLVPVRMLTRFDMFFWRVSCSVESISSMFLLVLVHGKCWSLRAVLWKEYNGDSNHALQHFKGGGGTSPKLPGAYDIGWVGGNAPGCQQARELDLLTNSTFLLRGSLSQ